MADLRDVLRSRDDLWKGRSTTVAARLDPRCSYSLFAAPGVHAARPFRALLAYIHGEGRRFQFLLNALAPVAKACNYLILCPLFPANILRDGNTEGYKYLAEGSIRYDRILLDMVAEVKSAFDFEEDRFALGGYSGGAQFAHRFMYLHPKQLSAVSIAAPGSVTLPDSSIEWWPGIGNMAEHFDAELNIHDVAALRLQLVIGEEDTAAEFTEFNVGSRYWTPDANVAGSNRLQRLRSLHRSLADGGIEARLDLVKDASHKIGDLLPSISDFFQFNRVKVP
jgi:poly(3-hydroxybutyrate) depolymerase